MSSWRLLATWMKKAEVSRRAVFQSLLATTVAQLSANALTIGAPLLLCLAWTQQDWHNPLQRIAVPLVAIELLAFFRSPLRFLDRMQAHRLGFAAVTQWRVWLTRRVATWSFRSTANTSRAELLQQSIGDIDHLQDVWLRIAVPVVASSLSFLISLGIIAEVLVQQSAVVPSEAVVIGIVLAIGLLVFVGLMSQLNRAVGSVRTLRRAHQKGFEELFDRHQLATELSLLGTSALAQHLDPPERYEEWQATQSRGEAWWRRIDLALAAVSGTLVVVASRVAVSVVVFTSSEPSYAVVLGVLGASLTGELFATWRMGLHSAANVVATIEGLEARGETSARECGEQSWPDAVTQFNIQGTFVCTPGSRIAVIGPSGSGKSTWLRGVANLEYAGATMLANSTYLNTVSEEELRQHVGYVSTEPHFLGTALVDELTLGRRNLAPWEPLATALGLSTDLSVKPSECSRGERHRYAVVRAMVAEPELLLLDEPTAGLGNSERQNLIDVLWASKATLVVTTHDPDLIAKCDVVISVEALRG